MPTVLLLQLPIWIGKYRQCLFDYFCIIYNLITNWSLQQIFGTVELYSMIDLKFIGRNSDYSRYASEKMIALCLFWVQLKIYVDPLPISWDICEDYVSRINVLYSVVSEIWACVLGLLMSSIKPLALF